jgi:nitrogen regulatory protein P-II 1
MKMITAIIEPAKLDKVREALIKAEITRLTVSRVSGHGRQASDPQIYRGMVVIPDLNPKVRLDIACNDDFVELCIDAICEAAREDDNTLGDGKIFVTHLEEVIRIRTHERGGTAI